MHAVRFRAAVPVARTRRRRQDVEAPDALSPTDTVLSLQRTAGNRATVAAISEFDLRGATLQRFGLSDVKDAYKHFQEWRHPEERKPNEDWSENSEDVARHAAQALQAAKAAYTHLAGGAMRRGDEKALREANEALEGVKKTGEMLEAGERVFKFSVASAKVLLELQEIVEAAQTLRDADLGDPRTQGDAAAAIDRLAGGFGRLAGEVLPWTPAKGYFDFLAAFSGARFFAHWAEFVHDYTDRIYHYSDEN